MILGSFASEKNLMRAVDALRNEGLGPVETHTPAPPENQRSGLKLVMLIAGLLGAAGGFGIQAWATGLAYPVDIGGRPNVFWPAYIPFALECGLLAAMLAGFFGFLIVNRMPTLYEPIDESDDFRRASLDTWFLALRTDDPDRAHRAMEILRRLEPVRIEELAS
jgi:ActD protein